MLQRGRRGKPGMDSVVEEEDRRALCLYPAATWRLFGAESCKMTGYVCLFLDFKAGLVGDIDALS